MTLPRFAVLAAALTLTMTARAAGVVETCRKAGDEQARIACLEGAVTALEAQLNRHSEAANDKPAAANAMGAEQVTGKSKENVRAERVEAQVSSFAFNGYGKLTVTLDNGQTWQQLDGDGTNLRGRIDADDTIAVDIKRSRFGGYRMTLTPPGKTLRVRRRQ